MDIAHFADMTREELETEWAFLARMKTELEADATALQAEAAQAAEQIKIWTNNHVMNQGAIYQAQFKLGRLGDALTELEAHITRAASTELSQPDGSLSVPVGDDQPAVPETIAPPMDDAAPPPAQPSEA
jgi:hypothetical protein